MPRSARVVIPGWPHHVTQRGNRGEAIFVCQGDGKTYLRYLQRTCNATGTAIIGYCLMPNHVHLILTPSDEAGLAKAVGQTHFEYSHYWNKRQGERGHLWQARFYSCPLETRHLWNALRYVEQNPVRAHLVEKPWQWRWSSAGSSCCVAPEWLLRDRQHWERDWTARSWMEFLERSNQQFEANLRSATYHGRPLLTAGTATEQESLVAGP